MCFGVDDLPVAGKAAGPTFLEVLPASLYAWSVDGSLTAFSRISCNVEVAAYQPEAARISEQWAQASDDPQLAYNLRHLSQDEAAELAAIVRRRWMLTTVPILLALPAPLLFFAVAQAFEFKSALSVAYLVASAVYLAYFVFVLTTRLPDTMRLGRDYRAKQVRVFVQQSPRSTVESLPFSNFIWSENGRPGAIREKRTL